MPRSKSVDNYEPVESVPDGLRWKPAIGRPSKATTILYSLGNVYKLERNRDTGAAVYFKHKDADSPKSSNEKIDAEPKRGQQVRYRVGAQCWFVESGHWFLCEVVERHAPNVDGQPKRIVIRSVTGYDADRQTPWGFGELLEFPAQENNPLFCRLRPLRDRYQ